MALFVLECYQPPEAVVRAGSSRQRGGRSIAAAREWQRRRDTWSPARRWPLLSHGFQGTSTASSSDAISPSAADRWPPTRPVQRSRRSPHRARDQQSPSGHGRSEYGLGPRAAKPAPAADEKRTSHGRSNQANQDAESDLRLRLTTHGVEIQNNAPFFIGTVGLKLRIW